MRQVMFLLVVVFLFSCASKSKKEKVQQLNVFAGVGMSDVISEIADSFCVGRNVEIKLNLAASGTLARQIEEGATVDVFLSANKCWMDYVVEREKSIESDVLTANDLVLVAAPGDTAIVADVEKALVSAKKKIAIGDPGYVPAGKYAMQVVEYYHLDLSAKLLYTVDVRSALMMVEIGEAAYGIVYKTDAIRSGKVNVVYAFPADSHDPILFYKVLVSSNPVAKSFYDYLCSDEAKSIFQKHQFIVI